MPLSTTRRTVLQAGAAVGILTSVPVGVVLSEPTPWTSAETPTATSINDVAHAADGAYAVGGGGYLLQRTDDGWRTVTKNGPAGDGKDLFGIDTTSNGQNVWFVGSGGAIGEYDVRTGTITDHSNPNDFSNQLNDVTLGGCTNVYCAGDSGAILYSQKGGREGTWNSVTPGSGSAITAIDVHEPRAGHAIDANQTVFETTDGSTWTKIGIDSADGSFFGVASGAMDDVTVSASGGQIYAYDGSQWNRTRAHTVDLRDVESDGETALSVGGNGTVLRFSGGTWTQEATDTSVTLRGVSSVGRSPEIAGGDDGTIVEK